MQIQNARNPISKRPKMRGTIKADGTSLMKIAADFIIAIAKRILLILQTKMIKDTPAIVQNTMANANIKLALLLLGLFSSDTFSSLAARSLLQE